MKKSYRVFIGPPPPKLDRKLAVTSWKTVSTCDTSPHSSSMTLPQTNLDRISLVYQNDIFDDAQDLEDLSIEWKDLDECSLHNASHSAFNVSYPTQTKEFNYTGDETTMISEGSSIGCFPTFNFSLNALSSLSSILQIQKPMSLKVTLLLGVLEIDGLSHVNVKTGPYAGSEVALLKLVVGDESGAICKMISWRETAELWGSLEMDSSLKRGDIILFENVMVSRSPTRQGALNKTSATLQLTASPNLKSQGQICYRTLPDTYQDQKLRPDLRLADSVPTVRKVREVVTWMERMAGITAQP